MSFAFCRIGIFLGGGRRNEVSVRLRKNRPLFAMLFYDVSRGFFVCVFVPSILDATVYTTPCGILCIFDAPAGVT